MKNYNIGREEYFKEYGKANRAKITACTKKWTDLNRHRLSEYQRKYRQNNKYKVNAKNAKRRADKLQRTPKWLTEQDFETMEMFYEFAQNLSQLSNIEYHVDHIIPLKGLNISGLHVPTNLQFLTEHDNVSKGNRY